jgi:hypothetical protein
VARLGLGGIRVYWADQIIAKLSVEVVGTMASSKKAARASQAAQQLISGDYLQRVIDNAQLRDSLTNAYQSGRVAYGRLQNGKGPAKALMEDKKLQKELRATAQALREAGESLRPPRRSRRRGPAMFVMVLFVTGVLALVLSEALRSKLLDAIFGAEEEFDYGSSNASAAPAPEPVPTN